MKKQLITKLVKGAMSTAYSVSSISESIEKQQKLMENYGKKPLLFFRKYVGEGKAISLSDFARASFISDSTVKRYASSSKKLVSMSRKRVAYGLMYFWEVLEKKAYEDLRDVL